MAQRMFKSITGQEIVVKSVSGVTIAVGAEPVMFPDIEELQQAAVNAGCIAVEVTTGKTK